MPVSAGNCYFCIMLFTSENIKKVLSQNLPGPASHIKMLPPGRELLPVKEQIHAKHSSVLLLLFIENDDLKVCLIKRPEHMKHHAGQIALPGGRIETGETALETALRETFEEIGVTPEQIEIIGSLSQLYVQVSHFLIHPFVGWMKEMPELVINKNEVEKTVLFPIKNLSADVEEAEIKTSTGRLKAPCIKYDGETIWGATAMILSEFFDVLQQSGLNN